MKIEASFVTSAATAAGLPRDGLGEVAMVGRSNVGKSSLINALVRQRVARTSAAPGKTRLANVYRVTRGAGTPFYLVDLPGYGYARAPRQARGALSPVEGRRKSEVEFETLTHDYFDGRGGRSFDAAQGRPEALEGRLQPDTTIAALLLVDARHPGLASDRAAWQWIHTAAERVAIVATKIDKLAQGERVRALRELESVFECSVLPVSAVTGEGLDELWTLIDRLLNNRTLPRRSPLPKPAAPPRPPRRLPRKNWNSRR